MFAGVKIQGQKQTRKFMFFGEKTKDLYSPNDILYSTDSPQKWNILSVGKNRNIYIVQKPIYVCGEQ